MKMKWRGWNRSLRGVILLCYGKQVGVGEGVGWIHGSQGVFCIPFFASFFSRMVVPEPLHLRINILL